MPAIILDLLFHIKAIWHEKVFTITIIFIETWLSVQVFMFLNGTYHFWNILFNLHMFMYVLASISFNKVMHYLEEGRHFLLFCSFLYPQLHKYWLASNNMLGIMNKWVAIIYPQKSKYKNGKILQWIIWKVIG
jgi:hypothetical protein